MDIASLKAFVAVAENRSFSRAAEQLFKTQPALSKRIAGLESDLDRLLFDRLGRELKLTEAGERLLVHANRILADVDASREDIRQLAGGIGGRLRFGTSHHIGLHRLPEVLKQFVQTYPDVELDLRFMDSEEACSEVANGDLELAVITLPDKPTDNLATFTVWPDPLQIVCGTGHPLLAELTDTEHSTLRLGGPERLADWPAILPARGTVTRSILLDALRPYELRINTALESNYLETIKMLVSVGIGWSVLPKNMVDDSIIAIDVDGLHMHRQLGAVWHQGLTLSRAADVFLQTLLSANGHSPKAVEY